MMLQSGENGRFCMLFLIVLPKRRRNNNFTSQKSANCLLVPKHFFIFASLKEEVIPFDL